MIRVLNTVATFPGKETAHRVWRQTTPKNLLAAADAAREYQRDVVAANGNAACSRTWVEVDGRPVDIDLLIDLDDAGRVMAKLQG